MSAIELGATLYVPAMRDALLETAYGALADLRSIVICLEDSIRDDHVDLAERTFVRTLEAFHARAPQVQVYVRPRNLEMLARMLKLPGIGQVRGFVLPKVTTVSLPHWLSLLVHGTHAFMPTIEGEEAFDRNALSRICDLLRPCRDQVTAIRIGGNDILNLLGVRRSRLRTAYDGPLGNAIRDIVATFVPAGFAVAAPVFEHYGSPELLREEVERDIEHGLLTKTAVHPSQVAAIQALYRPTAAEMSEARSILSHDADAVFGLGGSMCEPATHRRWAGAVVARAQAFGLATPLCDANSLVA